MLFVIESSGSVTCEVAIFIRLPFAWLDLRRSRPVLREIYLARLATGRNGGELLRETLRAYFAADRSGTSAAAALRITRQAVGQRLKTVEEVIGQPLDKCANALEVALQLEEHGYISA